MKFVYLIAYTLCFVGFAISAYHDDTQHMVWWGIIGLLNFVALKTEEIKEAK